MINTVVEIKSELATKGFHFPITAFNSYEISTINNKYISSAESVIKNPHLTDANLANLLRSSPLCYIIKQLIGEEIYIENTFLILKKPNSDFKVPLHQDGINPNLFLDPNHSVSSWISITESNSDNGGLYVYPQTHKQGYLDYEIDSEYEDTVGSTYKLTKEVRSNGSYINLKAGEAVLMNSALVHRSSNNRTSKPRLGLNVRWVNLEGIKLRKTDSLITKI